MSISTVIPLASCEKSACGSSGDSKGAPHAPPDRLFGNEHSRGERRKHVLINILKGLLVAGLLYLFICSLGFLADAFRLIAGRATANVFKNEYLQNPIVGLMIGILVTVLVQSSSTSTSIIVSMVSTELITIPIAVPMIFGSNIGTSVTNTIVSLTQVANREEFRRAFAGATVHDMFNWLTVITLLTVEVVTRSLMEEGIIEYITRSVVDTFNFDSKAGGKVKILKHITDPFTKQIIQIDKKVLENWSVGDSSSAHNTTQSLIPVFCKYEKVLMPPDLSRNVTEPYYATVGVPGSCHFLFHETGMTDRQVGVILLILALTMLCGALVMIVKILNSILKGSIAVVIKKTLNSNIPYVPWLTGYLAIFIGVVMTIIVQSSSIFTSTLTPLIGLDLITVERAYPLTLGSNIGTTTTALLASMAGSGKGLKYSIQIALVHLFFNLIGIFLFYPVPIMRFPIPMAKALGNITAKYRWFAILYLVMMFFLLPLIVFALSLAGMVTLYATVGLFLTLIVIVALINILQNKSPSCLPKFLQDWNFLPLPLRSLEPYNRVILSMPCCKKCQNEDDVHDVPEKVVVQEKAVPSEGIENLAYH